MFMCKSVLSIMDLPREHVKTFFFHPCSSSPVFLLFLVCDVLDSLLPKAQLASVDAWVDSRADETQRHNHSPWPNV